MAKRIGLARTRELINKNINNLHPRLKKARGEAGTQGDTVIIIGKNGFDLETANPFEAAHTPPKFPTGTKLEYGGRTFRYAHSGANTAAMGQLVDSPMSRGSGGPIVADAAVQANAAAGATTFSFTVPGGVSLDTFVDMLSNCFAHFNDGTGEGQLLKIKSNTTAGAGETCTVTLYDTLVEAIASSDTKVDIIGPVYGGYDGAASSLFQQGLLEGISTCRLDRTGTPVGVAMTDFAEKQYGWIQTHGPASVLTHGTVAATNLAVCSKTANGAIEAQDTSDAALLKVVGYIVQPNATTEYSVVYLTIE